MVSCSSNIIYCDRYMIGARLAERDGGQIVRPAVRRTLWTVAGWTRNRRMAEIIEGRKPIYHRSWA